MNKYKNFQINQELIPNIFIIKNVKKNEKFKKNISSYKLKEVLKNINYTIFVKE